MEATESGGRWAGAPSTAVPILIGEYRGWRGRAADTKLFALVDSSGYAGVAQSIVRRSGALPSWQSLFGLGAGDDGLVATPLLVDVSAIETNPTTACLVEQICREAAHANCVSFLASPLPLAALNVRLRARLDATLPGGMAVTMRYFDTRILPVLATVLDVQQRERFFGCARAWWYLDRRGNLAAVDVPHYSANDEFVAPLELSEKQERALILASEPDVVIDLLLRQAPDLMGSLPIAERYPFICGQIERARQFNISEPAGLALYVMAALELGARFDETEPWRQGLAAVTAGKTSVLELMQGTEKHAA